MRPGGWRSSLRYGRDADTLYGGDRGDELLLPGLAKQVAGTMGPRLAERMLTGALTAPPSPDTLLPSDDPPLTLWTERAD